MRRFFFLLLPMFVAVGTLAAQDTTRVDQGVRVGVDYRPGVRPGLVVLPGPGLDSVRAIVQRDLDYSDRFEMITVADPPRVTTTGGGAVASGGPVNYELYKGLGAEFAVELSQAAGGVTARLHDVNAGSSATSRPCPYRRVRISASKSIGSRMRSPGGPAEHRARQRAGCCLCPAGECTAPTATGTISRR